MLLLTTAVMLTAPLKAEASFLGWISRLSGPGPFWGLDAEVCVSHLNFDKDKIKPMNEAGDQKTFAPTLTFPCKVRLDQRHLSWNLHAGVAVAFKNPLDYTGAGVEGKSDNVWRGQLGTSLDLTLRPWIDIGAGGGLVYFAGERFDSFARGYVEPVRVTVRPLLWRHASNPAQRERDAWLGISAGWIIHLGTLDGADFGAPSDSFRTHNESNWQAGVSIDVLRLLKTR
jgi:hypothetical protein